MLRGMRKHLGALMEKVGLAQGKNHWSDEKLFNQTKLFLKTIDVRKFSEVSDEEVWMMVVLIYPNRATKAKSDGNERKSKKICEPLFNSLEQ